MSLMDKILEPTKGYISFPDLLFGLSRVHNEPLWDIAEYLDCKGLNRLSVFSLGPRYEVIPVMRSQEITYYFLEDVRRAITADNQNWVLSDSDGFNDLTAEEEDSLTKIFNAHSGSYYKKSELLSFTPLEGYLDFLKPESANENEGVANLQINNSLASYMTEYTLPQVVALILHIDLADITTSPSNSYIHENGRYDESTYSKFNNLLQSYSVAALNNKIDGADVFTRTTQNFLGASDIQTDLEKTTISRGNLASYLSSIGCQLDDLIAKQEPIHGVQSESEPVLILMQRLTELEDQLIAERVLQAETREEAIKANVKILNLTAKLEDAELESIIHSHPAHKLLISDANATIEKLTKENTDLRAHKEMSTNQAKQGDEVSKQTVEKLKKMTANYEELSLKYERINTQNKELLDKTEQHQQDNNEELIQHWEAESKKYQSRIEDLETVIEGFSDVETLSQDGDWKLYNWETMNVSQYPPELHLATEVWKRYYKSNNTEDVTQFNTGKFNRITGELNLKDGKLKSRIRSILTPLKSKKTSTDLLATLRDIDILYNNKMPD